MPKTRYRVIDPAGLDPRGGPRQLVRKADAAGFVVEVRSPRKPKGVISVGGISAEHGLAFTATWVDGKTIGCWLYSERDEGYREVAADVRVKIGKTEATRPTGYVAGVRLVYQGGPRGIRIGVDELKSRMAAL